MLNLKNIKINNEFAEADFYPETSAIAGHIVVDLNSEKITDLHEVEGYSGMHPSHARRALIEMAKNGDTRTERLVMWY